MATAAPHPHIRTDREHLSPAQRFGEVVALAIMTVVIGYFLRLLNTQAGFFTAAFGAQEQFWFFGPMFTSLAAPAVRILAGRRNPARPFEIVTDVLMVVGGIWLLRVFPFDFRHLGDALPGDLRFALGWVADWMGRWVLAVQVFAGALAAIVTAGQYGAVRLRQ